MTQTMQNNIFFTSDTHFLHDNIIRMSGRPYADVKEMESALIDNWNREVTRRDTVYVLGDFAISYGKKHAKDVNRILDSLVGNKILITGNHDRKEVTRSPHWAKVTPYQEIKLDLGGEHKQRIVMCHYALRVWNQMHRGSWMLHGHSHANLPDIGGKIMDVGVDNPVCEYAPISLDSVANIMSHRDIITYDHHTLDKSKTEESESTQDQTDQA